MYFDVLSILAYVAGLIFLVILCRIFIRPVRILGKMVLRGIGGGFLLFTLNFVGGFAGVTVIINPFSSLIAGLLGIPGVILVVALQYLL